jgi:hypothetical protein
MKKPVLIGLSIVVVLLLAGLVYLGMKYRQQGQRYVAVQQAEEGVRKQFDAALESIAEIQDSLSAIVPEEAHAMRLSQKAEMGGPITRTQKEQMLSTISDLKESIKNTKQRIRDLEKNLKSSQVKVTGLERIIANLKKSVEQREVLVQRLTARVDSLNVTVAGLKTDVAKGQEKIAEQQQVIEDKRREIGTIYYIVGTKKDLKDKGIIATTGGVIGLGKSVQLSGAFEQGFFNSMDTDQVTDVSIRGKEPQVLSAQSKSSYEIQTWPDGARLHILNVEEFRKVKYLVVMVK